jgi:hypothetical protein
MDLWHCLAFGGGLAFNSHKPGWLRMFLIISDCWVNGNNRLDDKIKNGYYPFQNHYSIIFTP